MIEGESLLNDGVAILMFRIFEEFLVEDKKGEEMNSVGDIVLKVFLKFCQIAIGGPCFGWFMGRMTILFLSYVFNDPPVEISATIVTAYLTYWISEDVIG
jgi:NhaP-type Na+/H+ or K+/H+ antiporter